ncbi:hypothetical protein N0V88_006545 [Collariella sp. IMI 366227]|nr:hypothetical protein N0V88_006545 [Collariella sp. IMI 366227]
MIPSMGLLNTLAVLQSWVSEHQLQGMSESSIGWIFSTYGFFLYFCGAQIEFYHFLLSFGVLGGISASLLFYPSVSAISHWFSLRRSLATGISFTAGGLGGVAYPLIILYLAPKIGFPWSIRIIALISAITCALACVLLKKRLPPNKAKGGAIDLRALGDPKYAIVTLAVFLVEFAVFIPYTYISSYAIASGMGFQAAYRLNALLNTGAIPGRVLPGYFADRFGVFNVMLITAFACTAFIFALWLPIGSNEAGITGFTVLYGFWSGSAIALTPVCIGKVCRTEDYGKRTGTTFFIASFGVLTGIPIAGAVLQSGGYRGLIVLAGAAYAAAVMAFAWAGRLIEAKLR